MQINRCQNFEHVRYLSYINGMQENMLGYFTDEGHLFYINDIKTNTRRSFLYPTTMVEK